MSDFNEGDRVIVISGAWAGEEFTVDRVAANCCRVRKIADTTWEAFNNLIKVNDCKKEEEKANLQEGDRVKVTTGKKKGITGIIFYINENTHYFIDTVGPGVGFKLDDLIKIEKEEKMSDFKVGDRVKVSKGNGEGTTGIIDSIDDRGYCIIDKVGPGVSFKLTTLIKLEKEEKIKVGDRVKIGLRDWSEKTGIIYSIDYDYALLNMVGGGPKIAFKLDDLIKIEKGDREITSKDLISSGLVDRKHGEEAFQLYYEIKKMKGKVMLSDIWNFLDEPGTPSCHKTWVESAFGLDPRKPKELKWRRLNIEDSLTIEERKAAIKAYNHMLELCDLIKQGEHDRYANNVRLHIDDIFGIFDKEEEEK